MSGLGLKIYRAVEANNTSEIKMYLANDSFDLSDLEYTYDERTAFYTAARLGYLECVKLLVDAGVDINRRNRGGYTAISVAVNNGHVELSKYLYMQGADIHIQNVNGESAYHYAWENFLKDDRLFRFFDEKEQSKNKSKQQADIYAPQQIVVTHDYHGHAVKDIYDFDNMMRISILFDRDGREVSFQRDLFKNIQDDQQLRYAFNKHRERGGVCPEKDVFKHVLNKSQKSAGLKNGSATP